MMTGYLARRTWLHRVPAGTKLVTLAVLSIILIPVNDWRILALALTSLGVVYASMGRQGLARLGSLKPLLPLILIIGALQAASEGWGHGVAVIMRILAMVLLADLVSMTTTMSALMEAMTPALRVLRPVGVNPRKTALAVTLVLRFVPVLLGKWQAREEAWRSRTRRRMPLRLVAAFIAEILQLADHVAEALDARGFDASSIRRRSTIP
jgi:biotin transport system permease protein